MNTTIFLKEREEALQATRASEERYTRLLSSVTDYAYTVRVDAGRVVSTSHGPGCEAVTGYTSAEFEADPNLWYRMIYEQDRGAVLVQNKRILDGENPPAIEHRIHHKSGKVRWIRNTAVRRCDNRGKLVAYDGYVCDVTERKLAEEQLGRAEQRYYDLLDNLTVGVCRNTPGESGRFLEVNAAMVTILEATSKEEVMQHNVSDFYVHPSKRKEISEKLARVGFLKDEELEFVTLKGRRFWGLVNSRATTSESGALFFDSVIDDITDRKRAEEALRSERLLMRTVLDNLPDVVYAKDLAGCKILSNRADLRLMGSDKEADVLGKTDFELIPHGEAAKFYAEDQRLMQTGVPILDREEYRLDIKGRPQWLQSSKVPLIDEGGKVIGLVGIGRDITERKLAQMALRESEERLALVIKGSNDGIWDWNLLTNQVYFSPRWKSMLGYDEHEVQDNFGAWESLVHTEDRERANARIRNCLSGETATYELEHRLRHKDGSYRWILARGVVQRGSDGKPVRMVGSHIDLTERKLALEQLRKAYAELARNEEVLKTTMRELKSSHEQLKTAQLQLIQAAKMESVGTLAAGVAHEVKNPLQTLLMGLEFLKRNFTSSDDNIPLVLADMRDAVSRANSIISELLQLSAAREFDLRPENLNALVERALRLINNELLASQTRVSLSLQAPLPCVRVDRVKMEQVLINLFINSLQAMSQEGVLTVRTHAGRVGKEVVSGGQTFGRFQEGDRVVIVEVHDTGPGIPEEHLARIFDPFFTTKPVGEGTGLGLSVVRQIMDMHGGSIDLANAPEGGVLATLVLRAVDELG